MDRGQFQEIALNRLQEAKVLLENECYDGAYYLSGYIIECALKACIAKKTREFEFPPNVKTVQKLYTHNLQSLLDELKIIPPNNVSINWIIVKEWSEQSRYERNTEEKAKAMFLAVTDSDEGVLQWLKRFW